MVALALALALAQAGLSRDATAGELLTVLIFVVRLNDLLDLGLGHGLAKILEELPAFVNVNVARFIGNARI